MASMPDQRVAIWIFMQHPTPCIYTLSGHQGHLVQWQGEYESCVSINIAHAEVLL